VASEPFNFILYECSDGSYELDAISNHSAFYFFITHRLTDAERADFKAHGLRSLQKLADRVRRNKG
jgi:hypothetical protein